MLVISTSRTQHEGIPDTGSASRRTTVAVASGKGGAGKMMGGGPAMNCSTCAGTVIEELRG